MALVQEGSHDCAKTCGTSATVKNRKINKSQFLNFLKKDETARNLAAISVNSNGQGIEIEDIILDIYKIMNYILLYYMM